MRMGRLRQTVTMFALLVSATAMEVGCSKSPKTGTLDSAVRIPTPPPRRPLFTMSEPDSDRNQIDDELDSQVDAAKGNADKLGHNVLIEVRLTDPVTQQHI